MCAPGTDANASYRMVTSYWEMVASFITSGVLNPELFYQSGRELLFCYARVRHVLPALREKLGNPGELKNLETVGAGVHRLVEPAVTRRLRRLLQAHRRLGRRSGMVLLPADYRLILRWGVRTSRRTGHGYTNSA